MRRIVLLSTLVLACSGCATYQDWHYSCSNYYRAYAAWHSMGKDSSPGRDHDYADGWKRGYYDVAMGRSGEPPAVPPEKYWAPKYQNASGQNAVQMWYRGYQTGAIAAEQEGYCNWNDVPSFAPASVSLHPHSFEAYPTNTTITTPTEIEMPSETVPPGPPVENFDGATTLIPQEDVPQVTLFGAPPRLGSPNRGFPSLPPRTTIRQVESIAQRSPLAPPAVVCPVVERLPMVEGPGASAMAIVPRVAVPVAVGASTAGMSPAAAPPVVSKPVEYTASRPTIENVNPLRGGLEARTMLR